MPAISAIFLVLSLTLAVLSGTQTSPWTWGPTLVCLMLALAAAVVALIRQPSRMLNPAMLVFGILAVLWFAIRAMQSPVQEFSQADLMLLGGTLGGFICVLSIQQCQRAQWILTGGIAALLFANLIVIAIQIMQPGYRPLLANTGNKEMVSGFFTHYNEAANYLMVCSLWVLGQAWHARRQVLRISLGLLGAIGLAAIYWTRSRGGFLSAILALACFGIVILIEAKRNKARWFPAAAIAIPFAVLILFGLLIKGWQQIQVSRGYGELASVSGVMDNTVRLLYNGAAASTMMSHPLAGGGSQSFGWECFKYLDGEDVGAYQTNPELVHNEWLQAATDYGLIGFGLLFGLLAVVGISAILRLCFEPKPTSSNLPSTSLRIGGIAALIGMLVHCNFSFIFHLIPGALMLGMCLAATCQWRNPEEPTPGMKRLQRGTIGVLGMAMLILITPLAWKGTRVMMALWPSHYGKYREQHAAQKPGALSEAIKLWPQASLLMQRAYYYHDLANAQQDEDLRVNWINEALADYEAAQTLHPYLPEPAINRANLLSQLGRYAEAEEAYARAIELQGGMEPTFRGHYLFALYSMNRGIAELENGHSKSALTHLERAAEHIQKTAYWDADARVLEISIRESLGLAYEANGMTEQALASYDSAAIIQYGEDGRRAHLRSALLQAAQANELRRQREPAKALGLYLQARSSVDKAGGQLPANITPEERDTFVRMLDDSIRQLREIGIMEP